MAASANPPEVDRLHSSLHRKRLQHLRQRDLRLLLPVQDRLDDVGREQREPQDTGQVGGRDPLALGQFGDGGELTRRSCQRNLA